MTRTSVKITLIFFSFKKHSHTTPHLKKKNFPLISSTIIKNLNYINLMKKISYLPFIKYNILKQYRIHQWGLSTIKVNEHVQSLPPQTYEPTKYNTGHGCVLCHHLQPSSWCSTQIDYNSCSLKKLKLSIQLNQLECRSCPITWREKKYQPT